MVRSMTGFGRSEQKVDGREITVEIKSVNHRYFEFGCRVSRGYAFLEEKLKAHIQKAVARGKIDVYVSISDCDEKQAEVTVNHSLAAGYVAALKELKDTYALSGEISVSDITRFNDIFTVHRTPEDEDAVWASVRTVLDSALESFIAMREQEGVKMKEDILLRSKSILSLVSSV